MVVCWEYYKNMCVVLIDAFLRVGMLSNVLSSIVLFHSSILCPCFVSCCLSSTDVCPSIIHPVLQLLFPPPLQLQNRPTDSGRPLKPNPPSLRCCPDFDSYTARIRTADNGQEQQRERGWRRRRKGERRMQYPQDGFREDKRCSAGHNC